MKKLFFFAVACVMALSSCDNHNGRVYVNDNNSGDVIVNAEVSNLGDDLNLQALGEMVKTSQNAEDLENKLNQPNSINNLDLDGNGSVDYINVTEYGQDASRGFSFTVDLGNGQKQEIATIEMQKGQGDQATMNINGNHNLYGNNAYYSSSYLMRDLLIWHYLYQPHPYYVSRYHYGYYPSTYRSYPMQSRSAYTSRVSTVTKTSKITRTTTPSKSVVKSPNATMNAPKVSQRAKTMAAPTSSQKSFSKTTNSRPSTSGFGSKSSKSSYSSPSRSSSSSSYSSPSRSSSRSSGFGSSSRSSSRSSSSSKRR